MTLVVVLALSGLVALLVAILTDSTWVALTVIALAAAGILLLLRDWRAEHRGKPRSAAPAAPADEDEVVSAVPARMSPDLFSPDISADSDGPSSDARAD